ncbi:MAG TPA: hypothetical protein VFB26_04325 [Gaiellaceae bacterium]|nr:hypothetical protein [Gaiellaceae bacterium]
MNRVLVVGVPRSGTSWVGRVLGSTPGATYLREPDNHEHAPFALRAKLELPGYFYPALSAGSSARRYEQLWQAALAHPGASTSAALFLAERVRRRVSGRLLRTASRTDVRDAFQAPGRVRLGLRLAALLAVPERPQRAADAVVVKSVHAQLALEWIAQRFPVQVLLVFRNPLDVVSSWLSLGWIDAPGADPLGELDPAVASALAADLDVPVLPAEASPLARATWVVCLLTRVLQEAARQHPDWATVSHEALCTSPRALFRELAARVGLRWGPDSDRLLEQLDREGSGYETMRVSSTVVDVWRTRLSEEQQQEALAVIRAAGLGALQHQPDA